MELLIIVLLILLNGVFAMSEMALVSSRRFKLESGAKAGSPGAKKALELSQHPTRFLSTVQIGITLIGILLGIYSGEKLTGQVQDFLNTVEFLVPYSETLATVLILIAITYLSIVLGELFPKRIGMHFPEKIISALAMPMHILSKVTQPFVWLLTASNNLLARLVGLKEQSGESVSEEELKAIMKDSAKGGEIEEIERGIVERVFQLGDRKVGSIVTHRTDLEYFEVGETWADIFEKVKTSMHTAYPLVRDSNLDEILGLVLVKDLLAGVGEPLDLESMLTEPLYFSETTSCYTVLESFKLQNNRYAIVVDEFGNTKGLVTMADLLDELIGESQSDSHGEFMVEEKRDGSFVVTGQMDLFEFSKSFDLDLDAKIYRDYATVAGLFYHYYEMVPNEGDSMEIEGFEFKVHEKENQKIVKFLIRPL